MILLLINEMNIKESLIFLSIPVSVERGYLLSIQIPLPPSAPIKPD